MLQLKEYKGGTHIKFYMTHIFYKFIKCMTGLHTTYLGI